MRRLHLACASNETLSFLDALSMARASANGYEFGGYGPIHLNKICANRTADNSLFMKVVKQAVSETVVRLSKSNHDNTVVVGERGGQQHADVSVASSVIKFAKKRSAIKSNSPYISYLDKIKVNCSITHDPLNFCQKITEHLLKGMITKKAALNPKSISMVANFVIHCFYTYKYLEAEAKYLYPLLKDRKGETIYRSTDTSEFDSILRVIHSQLDTLKASPNDIGADQLVALALKKITTLTPEDECTFDKEREDCQSVINEHVLTMANMLLKDSHSGSVGKPMTWGSIKAYPQQKAGEETKTTTSNSNKESLNSKNRLLTRPPSSAEVSQSFCDVITLARQAADLIYPLISLEQKEQLPKGKGIKTFMQVILPTGDKPGEKELRAIRFFLTEPAPPGKQNKETQLIALFFKTLVKTVEEKNTTFIKTGFHKEIFCLMSQLGNPGIATKASQLEARVKKKAENKEGFNRIRDRVADLAVLVSLDALDTLKRSQTTGETKERRAKLTKRPPCMILQALAGVVGDRDSNGADGGITLEIVRVLLKQFYEPRQDQSKRPSSPHHKKVVKWRLPTRNRPASTPPNQNQSTGIQSNPSERMQNQPFTC